LYVLARVRLKKPNYSIDLSKTDQEAVEQLVILLLLWMDGRKDSSDISKVSDTLQDS
jgi:hypothetical protein